VFTSTKIHTIAHSVTSEKPARGLAAVLGGTLFVGRTVTLTGSIFEPAELHGRIHFRCYGKWSAWFASVLDPQYGIFWKYTIDIQKIYHEIF